MGCGMGCGYYRGGYTSYLVSRHCTLFDVGGTRLLLRLLFAAIGGRCVMCNVYRHTACDVVPEPQPIAVHLCAFPFTVMVRAPASGARAAICDLSVPVPVSVRYLLAFVIKSVRRDEMHSCIVSPYSRLVVCAGSRSRPRPRSFRSLTWGFGVWDWDWDGKDRAHTHARISASSAMYIFLASSRKHGAVFWLGVFSFFVVRWTPQSSASERRGMAMAGGRRFVVSPCVLRGRGLWGSAVPCLVYFHSRTADRQIGFCLLLFAGMQLVLLVAIRGRELGTRGANSYRAFFAIRGLVLSARAAHAIQKKQETVGEGLAIAFGHRIAPTRRQTSMHHVLSLLRLRGRT
ncbi:hypothetical protein C8F04DRAFT_601357 [Mycena alexandri]|uniref:Uncharacterized protein n=1 Tax=Mycena alexandri TaxID=1745969 RepID=A0AAD6X399_9AGAR|nr:hypothetical protein C8F04DRAFT_601357 [Mycena alexandri]